METWLVMNFYMHNKGIIHVDPKGNSGIIFHRTQIYSFQLINQSSEIENERCILSTPAWRGSEDIYYSDILAQTFCRSITLPT